MSDLDPLKKSAKGKTSWRTILAYIYMGSVLLAAVVWVVERFWSN